MTTATEQILELRAQDPHMTATALATAVGVSRQRVSQILKAQGLPTKTPDSYAANLIRTQPTAVNIHIPGGPRLVFGTVERARAWLEAALVEIDRITP